MEQPLNFIILSITLGSQVKHAIYQCYLSSWMNFVFVEKQPIDSRVDPCYLCHYPLCKAAQPGNIICIKQVLPTTCRQSGT